MKGIKALAEDCAKYMQWKPYGPITLSISQIKELEGSRSTRPFKRKDDGWVYVSSQGREIEVKVLKINER